MTFHIHFPASGGIRDVIFNKTNRLIIPEVQKFFAYRYWISILCDGILTYRIFVFSKNISYVGGTTGDEKGELMRNGALKDSGFKLCNS